MANEEHTTMKSNVSQQKNATASLSQQATQTKEAVKDTVAETAANVKQQAQQTVSDAKQAVSSFASDTKATVKDTANEALGEAKAYAESAVDERKSQAADRLHGIAGALRETSTTLRGQQEDAFGDYAAAAADQVEKLSGYLRNQNIGNLLHDVEGFARRQPELFLAGTLAAGFMIGRFFKSSGSQQSQQNQGYGRYNQGYNQYPGQSSSMYGSTQSSAPQYGSQPASSPRYDPTDADVSLASASDYRGQAGYTQSQPQYGSQPQAGAAGSSGQYSGSNYDRQRGAAGQSYERQGSSNWQNASGVATQTAQNRSGQNDTEQPAKFEPVDPQDSSKSGTGTQSTQQNKGNTAQNQSFSRSMSTGDKER
jgi:hypothetical protein